VNGSPKKSACWLCGAETLLESTRFSFGPGRTGRDHAQAYSRDNFARGALLAATWLMQQPPGIYDMRNVLGPYHIKERGNALSFLQLLKFSLAHHHARVYNGKTLCA